MTDTERALVAATIVEAASLAGSVIATMMLDDRAEQKRRYAGIAGAALLGFFAGAVVLALEDSSQRR